MSKIHNLMKINNFFTHSIQTHIIKMQCCYLKANNERLTLTLRYLDSLWYVVGVLWHATTPATSLKTLFWRFWDLFWNVVVRNVCGGVRQRIIQWFSLGVIDGITLCLTVGTHGNIVSSTSGTSWICNKDYAVYIFSYLIQHHSFYVYFTVIIRLITTIFRFTATVFRLTATRFTTTVSRFTATVSEFIAKATRFTAPVSRFTTYSY